MRQPAKPKPNDVAETQRVIRIFDWLQTELAERYRGQSVSAVYDYSARLLEVADRIAARTVSDGN